MLYPVLTQIEFKTAESRKLIHVNLREEQFTTELSKFSLGIVGTV